MANGIPGMSGYGYGINGYYGTRNNNNNVNNGEPQPEAKEQAPQQNVNVNPNDVLNFLASQSIQINTTPAVVPANDAATAERIDGYVQNFEMIFTVIAQEFGEKVAAQLMNDDAFIDALMNL